MKYFDTHAHYYDERFSQECESGVDALLSDLLSDNVSYIVNIGTSPETCRLAILQAKKYSNMYTALGIHPSDAQSIDDIEEALREVEEMLTSSESKARALGEIGLDYHYPDTNRELQLEIFDRQMQMAERLSLPVVIHDREAHADCMEIIRRYPNVRGVFHSFSGSGEMAKELVRLGYMISFSGTVTFTNARRVGEACQAVPLSHLLIETDAPYLAPHPKRGTLNHSGNLVYTNARIASLHGITEEEAARITEENAKRFFSIV